MLRPLLFIMVLLVGAAPSITIAASAKRAWAEIENALALTQPTEDGGQPKPEEVFGALTLTQFRLEEFLRSHASDVRAWDARLLQLQVGMTLARMRGETIDWAAQTAALGAIADEPRAPAAVKLKVQAAIFQTRLQSLAPGDTAGLVKMARDLDEFYARHRRRSELARLVLDVADRLPADESVLATAMLKKVAADGDGELPQRAGSALRVLALRREPMELTFTAMDGAQVSLAELRGKVVLIDFWATWCPPCRDETPAIVGAYKRLHDQGFEIVGISLDSTKSKLLAYVHEHEMTWPQYFDGRGWDNALADRFGIHSIPAMWLLNKQGLLVDANARDQLEEKVTRLLAD